MKTRFYFMDVIRVFLTIAVFFHHSAIGFGASGGWYYISKETTSGLTQALLSMIMGVEQAYFMSLFFFISAFLMPGSFDKKGAKAFVMDRVKRLLIPLLIFIFILNPLLIYWIYGEHAGFGFGPMWFVFTLLVFEFCYVAYRSLSTKRINIDCRKVNPMGTIVFMLVAGAAAFLIRLLCPTGQTILWLQVGYFPLYIMMYALGIVARKNGWLDNISVKDTLPWFMVAIIIGIPALMVAFTISMENTDAFSGGWSWQAAFYAFWEPIMCVGICYFLLAFTKKHLNKNTPLIHTLSADSYSFYIIHPFLIVGCTMLIELLPISPLMRLLIVLTVGIPLCFLTAHAIRLATGKKWI